MVEQVIRGEEEENSKILRSMLVSEIRRARAVKYPSAEDVLRSLENKEKSIRK